MADLQCNIIDRKIFFTKLIESVSKFYEKDYVGHSIGLRNLHIMVLSENYKPERFEYARNLSIERVAFLTEVQVQVEEESVNYLYFL